MGTRRGHPLLRVFWGVTLCGTLVGWGRPLLSWHPPGQTLPPNGGPVNSLDCSRWPWPQLVGRSASRPQGRRRHGLFLSPFFKTSRIFFLLCNVLNRSSKTWYLLGGESWKRKLHFEVSFLSHASKVKVGWSFEKIFRRQEWRFSKQRPEKSWGRFWGRLSRPWSVFAANFNLKSELLLRIWRAKDGSVCQRIQDALRQPAFGDHLRSYQRNGQIPVGGYRPERGKRYPKVILLPAWSWCSTSAFTIAPISRKIFSAKINA